MNLAEQLDQFLDQEIDQTVTEQFTITDDSAADWAVRKALRYQRAIEEAERLADERIAKVESWRQQIRDENNR